ncbi:MAG TPA: chorismate-binding protein, partial [Gammaproteobacteria bacterium]|nr:chorismate-binding protein [Gammaproteobacteria bacterium]
MSNATIIELPYTPDSCTYFEQIRGEERPIFLDSCQPYSTKGRYDILSADPVAFLSTRYNTTTITRRQQTITSQEDPFSLLKAELAHYPERPSALPFNGGALGYFAYDLNKRIEKLPPSPGAARLLPDMAVGIYLWAIITDHALQKTYLLEPPAALASSGWPAIKKRLLTLPPCPTPDPFLFTQAFSRNMTAELYAEKFAQIQQHLQQGDCYQINFAQRWQAEISGDPWDLYRYLRQHNPAPFAAFIALEEGAILSCSPEQFLKLNTDKSIRTHPIKGTRARNSDLNQDKAAAANLLASAKDRAENTMIVDLMRNDLGKSCEIGSVQVPQLCFLQSFAAVHHLVSTISG